MRTIRVAALWLVIGGLCATVGVDLYVRSWEQMADSPLAIALRVTVVLLCVGGFWQGRGK